MATISVRGGASGGGLSISGNNQRTVANQQGVDVPCGPAWAGTLSTRTDDNTGTLTMTDAGHTIATGNKICIYWASGSQHTVTVGTVSGTSVPFDSGVGDNLPAQTTAITACVEVVEPVGIVGDNLKLLSVGSGSPQARCSFDFRDASHASLWRIDVPLGESVDWVYSGPFTNPIAGDEVAEVAVSTAAVVAATALVIAGTDAA